MFYTNESMLLKNIARLVNNHPNLWMGIGFLALLSVASANNLFQTCGYCVCQAEEYGVFGALFSSRPGWGYYARYICDNAFQIQQSCEQVCKYADGLLMYKPM